MNPVVSAWYRQGCPVNSKGVPHEVKAHVISTYAAHHSIDTFVETGTCHGAMVQAVAHRFKNIHTVEMYPPNFEIARERLAQHSHVECYLGDSAEVLQQIVDALDALGEPALFFLDAHYSGGGTARGEDTDTPIVRELEILAKSTLSHVTVIDDARLFAGEAHHTPEFADYPSFDWITNYVADNFALECTVTRTADEFVIEPA